MRSGRCFSAGVVGKSTQHALIMPAVQWSSFTLFPCLHRPSFGWPRAHLRLAGKKLQESREQLPSSSYGLKQLLRPKCQASAMGSVKTLRLSSWCHSNYDASRACLHLLHSYCSTPTDQVEHTSAEIRPDIDRFANLRERLSLPGFNERYQDSLGQQAVAQAQLVE